MLKLSRFSLSSILLALMLSLNACSSDVALESPEVLYSKAKAAMQEMNYSEAIELFSIIQSDFPFSSVAADAELSLADAYFLNGDFLAAADAYKLFNELHPRLEVTPYVIYQTALSLKNVNNSVDKTVAEAGEAIQYLELLMSLYPNSEFSLEAPQEILNCKTILAEHELYLAETFWNMGNKGAAYERYMYVFENFPELTELASYAFDKAKSAYFEHVKESSEEQRKEEHGSWTKILDWL